MQVNSLNICIYIYTRVNLVAMALIKLFSFSGFQPGKEIHLMAARGFERFSRWFQRSSAGGFKDEDDRSERNGLLRSQLDQIVPVTDFAGTSKALAVHMEPKVTLETRVILWYLALSISLFSHMTKYTAAWTVQTVALKVSMHCHGCARKVEKQVSKLQGRR
jgi:hypothetical protein